MNGPPKTDTKAVTLADVVAKFGEEALDYPDARPGNPDPGFLRRVRETIEARLRDEATSKVVSLEQPRRKK